MYKILTYLFLSVGMSGCINGASTKTMHHNAFVKPDAVLLQKVTIIDLPNTNYYSSLECTKREEVLSDLLFKQINYAGEANKRIKELNKWYLLQEGVYTNTKVKDNDR